MTLGDLKLYKFEFSVNFSGFRRFLDAATAKRMKIGQYCQRQRCKHVELEQFLACFRVALVSQRQLGFLVFYTLLVVLGPYRVRLGAVLVKQQLT